MTAILGRLSASLEDRYTIERELGQGGMATVFLAIDRRHERHVAIKVLHPELSAVLGADRFLSEIKLTASLQHPHILPLFDSGVADGLVYYVMPFVEGETLRARLDRERQLPVGDAVRLATEIAGALQYAHDRGVVHRDIKPENVLLQNGHAIVADFGIALAVQQAGGSRMTQTGMSLGTPQYMAPEQAMGERNVDARADIYALGAVTYELLAGEPPFTGPTAQSIVAKVVTERSRALRTVRDTVPPNVEFAVASALEKLPADRPASAQAFADALRQTDAAGGATAFHTVTTHAGGWNSVSKRIVLAMITLALVTGGVVGSLLLSWLRAPVANAVAALPLQFEVMPPDSVTLRLVCCGQLFAISSDGRWLVYQGTPAGAAFADSGRVDHQLYLRDLTDLSVRALPGTRNALDLFFSPDNSEIGFVVGQQLRRLRLSGGDAQTIATLPPGFSAGGSWSTDGTIAFAVSGVMLRVSANGGMADTMFRADSAEMQFFGPRIVEKPYVLLYGDGKLGRKPRIMWRSLTTGATHAVTLGSTPTYVESERALLVVRSDGLLVRYPFDIEKGDTTGPATRIASDVQLRSPIETHAEYSASQNGTVVLVTRRKGIVGAGVSLVDLRGSTPSVTRALSGQSQFLEPSFSRDGKRLAVLSIVSGGESQAMIFDVTRGAATTLRLPGISGTLNFSSSSDSLVYRVGGHDVYMAAVDGSGEPERVLTVPDLSPSDFAIANFGPWFAFESSRTSPNALSDIYVAHRDSGGRAFAYASNSRAVEKVPAISPDGKWLAYASDDLGTFHVYVSAFPKPAGRFLLTPDGGQVVQWASDSRTLYFTNEARVYSISFTPGPEGSAPVMGAPKLLYSRDPWGAVGISPDGKWFAFVDRRREGDPKSLVVRTNAVGAVSR